VFFAIAIIITAYLPIFTLQQLKAVLQADGLTVAFALLGAMTFSIRWHLCSSALFRKGVRERRNPIMEFLTVRYRRRLRGPSSIVGSRLASVWLPSQQRSIWDLAELSARSSCLTWTKAPSGRAAHWRRAPT
jgi:hypothetical protein